MYELWVVSSDGEHLVGQYHTRKQAVAIGRDYLSRGFRAKVKCDDKQVWDSCINPRCALK